MKALKNHSTIWRVAALVLAAPLSSLFAAAQTTDSVAVSRLLKQAKVDAAQARNEAEFLDANSMTALEWQVDVARLMRVEEHVKDLDKDLARLEKLRSDASPQQKEAIDGFQSLMANADPKASSTMWWLYKDQHKVNMPAFRDRAHEDMVAVDKVYQHLNQCTSKSFAGRDTLLAAAK
jgi:hypothetical protein